MAAGDIYSDSNSIHIEDNPTLVSGSKKISRDISQSVNWWGVAQPTSISPVPLDSAGRAMRLCSAGHYDSIDHFARNKARKDGKDNYCHTCRKVINHRAEKTAVGEK